MVFFREDKALVYGGEEDCEDVSGGAKAEAREEGKAKERGVWEKEEANGEHGSQRPRPSP